MNERDSDGEQGEGGLPPTLPEESPQSDGTLGYPRLIDEVVPSFNEIDAMLNTMHDSMALSPILIGIKE